MGLQELAVHFVCFTIGALIGLVLWEGMNVLFQLIRNIKHEKD